MTVTLGLEVRVIGLTAENEFPTGQNGEAYKKLHAEAKKLIPAFTKALTDIGYSVGRVKSEVLGRGAYREGAFLHCKVDNKWSLSVSDDTCKVLGKRIEEVMMVALGYPVAVWIGVDMVIVDGYRTEK